MSTLSTNSTSLLEIGTNEVELIEFYLGSESYGINVSKVLRVIARSEASITPMADSHPCICGITHIQDRPVPVIDLRKALGVNQEPRNPERQLLLVLQFNQQITSYVIDGINKIHRTSWQNFKPVTQNQMGSKGYINGTVRLDDHVILFLDVEYLQNEFSPASTEDFEAFGMVDPAIQNKRGEIQMVFVEDSPTIRKQTAKALALAGFSHMNVFENGLKALHYIQNLHKQAKESNIPLKDLVNVIITDVEMPEMDGLTLCKNIKSATTKGHSPDVIVYSSLINEQMEQKCKSVDADATVAKPQIEKLIATVDNLYFIG